MFYNIFPLFSKIPQKNLQESEDLLDPEAGAASLQSPKEVRRCIRWPIMLLLVSSIALLAAAGSLCLSIVLREQGYHQFSCPHDDQVCLQQICPQGMIWNQDKEECLTPDGWACCTVSSMKICYEAGKSDQSCPYEVVQVAGISPFLKEFCRPGFIWVPRLKRCWRKIWRAPK